jgi:hypothetical protein
MKPSDIPHVQQANITNLPENYFLKYYLYHALAWPQLSYVAVDVSFLPFSRTVYLHQRLVTVSAGKEHSSKLKSTGLENQPNM